MYVDNCAQFMDSARCQGALVKSYDSILCGKHFCDHRNGKKYAAIRALRVNLALLVQPIDAQLPSPPTAAISSTAISTAKRSS